jgi:hypothetical protein
MRAGLSGMGQFPIEETLQNYMRIHRKAVNKQIAFPGSPPTNALISEVRASFHSCEK